MEWNFIVPYVALQLAAPLRHSMDTSHTICGEEGHWFDQTTDSDTSLHVNTRAMSSTSQPRLRHFSLRCKWIALCCCCSPRLDWGALRIEWSEAVSRLVTAHCCYLVRTQRWSADINQCNCAAQPCTAPAQAVGPSCGARPLPAPVLHHPQCPT